MKQFDTEQLAALKEAFKNIPEPKILPVRDGFVTYETKVWWRGKHGPEHVLPSEGTHWANIKAYPSVYQLAQPVVRKTVTYLDSE